MKGSGSDIKSSQSRNLEPPSNSNKKLFKMHSIPPANFTHSHKWNHPSYLLALGYSEQLNAATHSVLQLSALALDWKANLVEPTLVTSHIFGIKGVYPPFIDGDPLMTHQMRLFDVYDASKINQVLHLHISPHVSMRSFQTFLLHAPRNITLLHFNTRSRERTKRLFALSVEETEQITSSFRKANEAIVLEYPFLKMSISMEYVNKIENQLNWMTPNISNHFRVVRILYLNPKAVYTSVDLSRHLVFPGTFIFTNWHGCGRSNCTIGTKDEIDLQIKKPKNAHREFRYTVLTKRSFSFSLKREYLLHLPSIEKEAGTYLALINFTKFHFVSVHLRMERIIRRALADRERHYQFSCIVGLQKILNRIVPIGNKTSYKGSHHVLLISDFSSKYGTDSCSGRNCNKKEVIEFHSLLRHYVDFHSYQPDTLNRNSGFVSLVEMHMLALGKKLVLVGYGGFQSVLEQLFLSKGHTKEDVYHISC